jgi:hypothetical protein
LTTIELVSTTSQYNLHILATAGLSLSHIAIMHFTTALPALALFGSALAAAIPAQSANENFIARRAVSGKSTFYGGNVQGGTCSFSTYTLPAGLYGTAFSGQAWNNAANCGGCVKVSHAGKSITAMVSSLPIWISQTSTNHSSQIVDKCPECDEGHLDLFSDAFAALDSPSKGIIDTSYEFVDCPKVSGPLTIHTKSGVSQYWFGKTWKAAARTEYNFFEIPSGVGAAKASIRVTSGDGKVVVVKDVPMEADKSVKAASNYN